MTASRISREQMRKLRFFQNRSYISVDFASRRVEAFRVSNDGSILPVHVNVGDSDALTAELRDFLDACRTGGAPTVTGEEGLRALMAAGRIAEAIENASRRFTTTG
jgi:predicted dehydrogenase